MKKLFLLFAILFSVNLKLAYCQSDSLGGNNIIGFLNVSITAKFGGYIGKTDEFENIKAIVSDVTLNPIGYYSLLPKYSKFCKGIDAGVLLEKSRLIFLNMALGKQDYSLIQFDEDGVSYFKQNIIRSYYSANLNLPITNKSMKHNIQPYFGLSLIYNNLNAVNENFNDYPSNHYHYDYLLNLKSKIIANKFNLGIKTFKSDLYFDVGVSFNVFSYSWNEIIYTETNWSDVNVGGQIITKVDTKSNNYSNQISSALDYFINHKSFYDGIYFKVGINIHKS